MVKKVMLFGLCSLVFALSLCSCANEPGKSTFVISGTYLDIISRDSRAAKIAYNEFKRLDGIFNIYDQKSELAKLNLTYNKPVAVSDELFEVIKLAKQLYIISEGRLDVSQGVLYSFWKDLIKGPKMTSFPSKEKIAQLKKTGGMDNIAIDEAKKTVTIKKEGLKIDLSSIAKGYMVDKAALKLKEAGIESALVNAGGEVYCLGSNDGLPWSVGIKDPKELGGILETQGLIDEAIATSGDYEQFFDFGGKRYSHIIDPVTGFPVENNIISVSVITKNCVTADGIATSFFVMGVEQIKRFLSNNPSTMRIFVLVLEDGKKRIHFFK